MNIIMFINNLFLNIIMFLNIKFIFSFTISISATFQCTFNVFVCSALSQGAQTVNISHYFPEYPYIVDFCNLTQVRCDAFIMRILSVRTT